MATRSAIGMVNTDGSVRAIYCHFDGYPSHNGRLLIENYNNADAINKLLDLGDLSVLDKTIGDKCNFDKRIEGQCLAYGRDRGETEVDAVTYPTVNDFRNQFRVLWVEYWYLFDGKDWQVSSRDNTWTLLEVILEEVETYD